MDAAQVKVLFRQAVTDNDAIAMRQGLEGLLGADGDGLSPEREHAVRRPDVVIEMPQSRERIRGHDAMREMQEMFPAPGPAITVRNVAGCHHVWIAEADVAYGEDKMQSVVIFELDGDGLIVSETRYYTQPFEAPAWRAALVETMS